MRKSCPSFFLSDLLLLLQFLALTCCSLFSHLRIMSCLASNRSQSFPQLFVSFGAPLILAHFDNDVSSVMFVGGILALIGFVLIFVLRVDIFDGDDYISTGSDGGSNGDHVPIAEAGFRPASSSSSVRSIPMYDGTDREPFLNTVAGNGHH
jgi:hypothetical protein